MRMFNTIYRLSELKQFESKLKSAYNRNQYFKRISESNKKEKNDDNEKYVIITEGKDKNVFAGIPNDVIDYLEKTGDFNMEILDIKNNTITVKDYFELLDTIRCLLSILEYDLLNAYFQKNEN